jgi:hypothetical protein
VQWQNGKNLLSTAKGEKGDLQKMVNMVNIDYYPQ